MRRLLPFIHWYQAEACPSKWNDMICSYRFGGISWKLKNSSIQSTRLFRSVPSNLGISIFIGLREWLALVLGVIGFGDHCWNEVHPSPGVTKYSSNYNRSYWIRASMFVILFCIWIGDRLLLVLQVGSASVPKVALSLPSLPLIHPTLAYCANSKTWLSTKAPMIHLQWLWHIISTFLSWYSLLEGWKYEKKRERVSKKKKKKHNFSHAFTTFSKP